ncbi:MAG TPA: DUF1003 domain-containing protein [Patescibacteria group bacterium]|jgi:uncharacterized membrane protein|nr:DUF1003 domain-containing protein [Patescibacteria group bacterium]
MSILKNLPFFEGSAAEEVKKRKQLLRSFKAKADAKRTTAEKLADWMTETFGTFTFLVLNLIFFAVWLLINTGFLPGMAIFDPYPFNMLTSLVSLEAIILAVFVLISQNRAQRIDDLREEVDLQVNVIAENEITKIMNMLYLLLEKNGIDLSQDPELKKMLKRTSTEDLEKHMEKELS